MRVTTVTKRVKFDSSHYLYNSNWDKDKNIEQFHACSKFKEDGTEVPHGHTYVLEVTVEGIIDEETGFVIDFKELKRILKSKVISVLDHNLINNVGPFKDGLNTTVENLCYFIFDELVSEIDDLRPREAFLQEVKLWECYPDSYGILTRQRWIASKMTGRCQEGDCSCDCDKEEAK